MKKIFTLFPAILGLMSVQAQAENVTFKVYNDEDAVYEKSFESDLSIESGVYTIANFMNSGSAVQFIIDSSVKDNNTQAILLTGNAEYYTSYTYPLDNDGNYLQLHVFDESDNETITYNAYVYEDDSYAEKVEVDGVSMYECVMWVSGDIDEAGTDYAPYYVLEFYAPDPDAAGIKSALVDDADANAPVEYFNLQGIRVENPENGLYIRRQGSKASKVMVK